ncbi:MAG: helix-turn-helix domain-containing protein [Candidatus Magasanikbacteria bacterium]|nr:helix-turn-helix domain-containing protein [Candidatus Magasanikbacteria bacterium]
MKKILKSLGLSDKETMVYLALLNLGTSNATALAEKTSINRVTAYPVLEQLLKRGLVSRFKKKGKLCYNAEDPRRLQEMEEKKYRQIEILIPQLMAQYHTGGVKPEVRFYEGHEGLNTLFFDSIHNNKTKEIFFLYPAWDIIDIFGKPEVEHYVAERVKSGIRVKAIRQHEKEVSFKEYPHLASDENILREVRFAPEGGEFSVINAIYDDRIAFIASKKENFGLLIQSPSLVRVMRMYFLSLWKQCKRLN